MNTGNHALFLNMRMNEIEVFIREEPACINTLKEGHSHIKPEWRRGRASQPGLKDLHFSLDAIFPSSGLAQLGWAS